MKEILTFLLLIHSICNFSQNTEIKNDTLIYDLSRLNVKPEFPQGAEKLNLYIKENLLKVGIQTKTKVKNTKENFAVFIVEKDGSLSDIKIYGNINTRKSEEVIRILKSSPRWNPGKQNGIIVRVHYPLLLSL